MQLGGVKPITDKDWQMPRVDTFGQVPVEKERDESAAQLVQIKWLMVALILIILINK